MIRVEDSTKGKLKEFKGTKSYNDIIDDMVNFFLNTGLRPSDNMATPVIVVQQESTKLQKIIRAIESKQNMLLKDILERSNFLVNASQKAKIQVPVEQPAVEDNENYMNVEEVQQLMAEYKRLEMELKSSREENNRLRLEMEDANRRLSTAAAFPNSNINTKIISECLDKLVERKSSTMFDGEKYTIRKSDFNMCIDTIREELKK